jgi:RNA polymerase sigma factor (sigma-70 family)
LARHIVARFGSDLAEDVAQVALVAVWRHWKRSGAPDDPSAYAARVAIRSALRFAQAAEQIRTTEVTEELPENRSAQEVESIPLRVDLDRAMRKLPDRQRAIMRLHLAGKTNQEIADLLKISPGTVGAQLHTARDKLRACLGNWTGR